MERPPSYHLGHGQHMMDGTPRRLVTTHERVDVEELRCASSSSSCRASGAGASSLPVQPLHPGLEPARSPVRLPGEEHLVAEAHRGAGGGEELPALPAGPLHRQPEEP